MLCGNKKVKFNNMPNNLSQFIVTTRNPNVNNIFMHAIIPNSNTICYENNT